MTPNGKQCLEILVKLEGKSKDKKFTANEITEFFDGLENRTKPVMTVSSYLTHLKREGFVEREASSDKTTAWWSLTSEGRKAAKQQRKLVNA